jgi:hypothetical protein
MNLIKELLSLTESNDPDGKGRLHSGRWEEITFKNIDSLEELANEIADDGHDGKKIFKALPELHDYLQNYHIGRDALKNDVFDVGDESYDVESDKDDMLKVTYQFTVRFKRDGKDPVTHRGEITFQQDN